MIILIFHVNLAKSWNISWKILPNNFSCNSRTIPCHIILHVLLGPKTIVRIILVKLPVKSLIRGTSVCKQWRSLIRSPSFISTHLSITENQALVGCYDIKKSREHYKVIPKRGPFVINSDLEFEFPFKSKMGYFRKVGSCDGLVCLCDDRIMIWNPAIRNHLVLPQPQLFNQRYYNESVLGFGVANNVYKVVRLFYCNELLQAEIFCLGGTGRWRKLNGFNDVRVRHLIYLCCPIFFNGFVHLIDFGGENSERNSILRFHFGDEVFSETMLPEELERVTVGTGLSLYIMEESLGAIKYDWNIGCDVWMMKDYGIKESWTKLYKIDTVRYLRVIGFRGNNEAVLEVRGCEVVTYNPETKGFKHVGINRATHSFYVGDYKESLVLLGGYSGDSGE